MKSSPGIAVADKKTRGPRQFRLFTLLLVTALVATGAAYWNASSELRRLELDEVIAGRTWTPDGVIDPIARPSGKYQRQIVR